jgi:hypothetical protein
MSISFTRSINGDLGTSAFFVADVHMACASA